MIIGETYHIVMIPGLDNGKCASRVNPYLYGCCGNGYHSIGAMVIVTKF